MVEHPKTEEVGSPSDVVFHLRACLIEGDVPCDAVVSIKTNNGLLQGGISDKAIFSPGSMVKWTENVWLSSNTIHSFSWSFVSLLF